MGSPALAGHRLTITTTAAAGHPGLPSPDDSSVLSSPDLVQSPAVKGEAFAERICAASTSVGDAEARRARASREIPKRSPLPKSVVGLRSAALAAHYLNRIRLFLRDAFVEAIREANQGAAVAVLLPNHDAHDPAPGTNNVCPELV